MISTHRLVTLEYTYKLCVWILLIEEGEHLGDRHNTAVELLNI